MLFEPTLFGDIDKVKTAIERLQMFEPPEGYKVGFSGGKDSIVIKHLVKLAGVKAEIEYNKTTVDPPELVQYIKRHHEDVAILSPEKTMWQLIPENGIPPLRQQRYCCRILKERGNNGRMVSTGVRWEESAKRKNRQMAEACYHDPTKRYLHPIIDWTKRDVWEFIHKFKLPYCSLYDEGWERIGCVCCPNANQLLHAQRWPKIAEAYKRACVRAFEERKRKGLKLYQDSGEAMFYWWISGASSGAKEDEDPQERFYFE